MAPRPKFRKPSNILPRVISSLILIPLSLYIIYLGPPFSIVLASIVTIGLFIEWAILALKNELGTLKKIAFVFLGTGYIGFSLYFLFMNFFLPEGWRFIFWLLILVWSTDISAFAGGKFLRGPTLAPNISPNKTWSGFIVGMLMGTSVSYGASLWLLPGHFTLIGIILLVLIGQLGDLLESKAKRLSNIKDSSQLIPGHGGLLDRLDSLIAVGFALGLWQFFHST